MVLIFLLFSLPVTATTFIHQSLDELDQQADYVIMGTVLEHRAFKEKASIVTETTIAVDETLRGPSQPLIITVKELGGMVDDVLMVVPGSPQFDDGERIALFFKEDRKSRMQSALTKWGGLQGHTVGMGQGKFRILRNADGVDILRSDLHGAHLLVELPIESITLDAFRARYSWWARFTAWLRGFL